MSHCKCYCLLTLWVLVLLSQSFQSCCWFGFFGNAKSSENPSEIPLIFKGVEAEFSIEAHDNKKGLMLVENAKRMASTSNSCWQNAYQNLFASCSKVLASEEKRSRLAWYLSDCFQKDTGRVPLPLCDTESSMVDCLKELNEDAHRVYLEFYLETNTICHQLQAHAFKLETQTLVNELKKSAENAETTLEKIQRDAEDLQTSSDEIQQSLSSIGIQTQEVAQTSKNVEDRVNVVLNHSKRIYDQSIQLAASQLKLHEGQEMMKENLVEGMTMLNDSSRKLGTEINKLKDETFEIEKEIGKVGHAMSSKMETLQSKADVIGNIAEISLNKQKQLLGSQNLTLELFQNLTKSQSKALLESRDTLRELVKIGSEQQKELIRRQEDLRQAHDRLVESSEIILAAQETFGSRQASMFVAIDKLFTLHNAILLESRAIKAFIVYSILIFVLYMFTSTKQTYNVRPGLYFGLCVTFFIEFAVLRYGNDIDQQALLISLIRLLFGLLASGQLLYAICTYRDYEALNHQMLLSLIEKVNGMQRNKEFWESDSEVDWSSWIDADLQEDVGMLEDPDYMPPEEVVENRAISPVASKFNLRLRR